MKKFLFNILNVFSVTVGLFVITFVFAFAGLSNEMGGQGNPAIYDVTLWTLYGVSIASTIWLAFLVGRYLVRKGKKGSKLAWIVLVLLIVSVIGIWQANYRSGIDWGDCNDPEFHQTHVEYCYSIDG